MPSRLPGTLAARPASGFGKRAGNPNLAARHEQETPSAGASRATVAGGSGFRLSVGEHVARGRHGGRVALAHFVVRQQEVIVRERLAFQAVVGRAPGSHPTARRAAAEHAAGSLQQRRFPAATQPPAVDAAALGADQPEHRRGERSRKREAEPRIVHRQRRNVALPVRKLAPCRHRRQRVRAARLQQHTRRAIGAERLAGQHENSPAVRPLGPAEPLHHTNARGRRRAQQILRQPLARLSARPHEQPAVQQRGAKLGAVAGQHCPRHRPRVRAAVWVAPVEQRAPSVPVAVARRGRHA